MSSQCQICYSLILRGEEKCIVHTYERDLFHASFVVLLLKE